MTKSSTTPTIPASPNVGSTGWDILRQVPRWLLGLAAFGFLMLMGYSIFFSNTPFQIAGMQFGASATGKDAELKALAEDLKTKSTILPVAWVFFDYPKYTGHGIAEIKSTGESGQWLVTFDQPIKGNYAVVSSGNQLGVTVRKKTARSLMVETWNEGRTEKTYQGVFNLIVYANGNEMTVE